MSDEKGRHPVSDRDSEHPQLMDPDWQQHAEKETWVDYRQQRRRAKRNRRLAFWLVALAALAGGTYGAIHSGTKTSAQHDAGASTSGAAPTNLPGIAKVDLTHPFVNTPAQNWGEGIVGLTAPAPAQIGEFSATQVGDALTQVKQAIIAAHLDQDTLYAHKPDKYAALLAPYVLDDLREQPNPPLVYIQDGFHLLPVAPRMMGSLTVRTDDKHELVVHANYVVAYAFDPGSRAIQGPSDIEPFVRVETDYLWRSGPPWTADDQGLVWDNYNSYVTAAACKPMDSGLLAPAYSDETVVTSISDEPGQFDPAQPVPTLGNCPTA